MKKNALSEKVFNIFICILFLCLSILLTSCAKKRAQKTIAQKEYEEKIPGEIRVMFVSQQYDKIKTTLKKHPDLAKKKLKDGSTLLHESVRSGSEFGVKMINLLVNMGADVNAKDKEGNTPLHLAGDRAIAEILVKKKAKINLDGHHKWSALMKAASGGKVGIVEFLLDNGADMEHKATSGCTALIISAMEGKVEVVKILISKGADLNVISKDIGIYMDQNIKEQSKWTALHWAVYKGNKEVVVLLLENGADATIKDKYNRTPKKLAEECKHKELVKVFDKYSKN
ncbi:MAG: ankyrin repeat domain-containing protein [Candidatus Eremiobacteraeota bacterium]|nr:ankyrin repeat domain-containing protein [Candidatus Eremiobacteraeota bacterium]